MIPVIDDQEQVINIYGININDDNVKSLNDNLLFNQKACKVYDEIILTESIIDALSLIELSKWPVSTDDTAPPPIPIL